MRKLIALAAVTVLAAVAAGPATASHETGQSEPHNCLGAFHSEAAQNPAYHPLGQAVVNVLLPMAHPFGSEFVKDRATECEGL